MVNVCDVWKEKIRVSQYFLIRRHQFLGYSMILEWYWWWYLLRLGGRYGWWGWQFCMWWGCGAVECGRFYYSPPKVVECWWCWPASKDHIASHPYSVCHHYRAMLCSHFRRGLISHTSSRKLASFHIGVKSTKVQSFPCPWIGLKRGAGICQD